MASRDAAKAKDLADRYQIGKSYGSYDELLADPEIDAVYIPLPNHLHKSWTIKAAEAGKHVLCEKPAALTVADVREMAEAARKNGVLFAEAFMYRYHPKHARVREIIESGRSGSCAAYTARSPATMRMIKAMSATARRWAAVPSMIWAVIRSRLRG